MFAFTVKYIAECRVYRYRLHVLISYINASMLPIIHTNYKYFDVTKKTPYIIPFRSTRIINIGIRVRKYVSRKLLPFRKKKKIAFKPSFWCVCARGKRNPEGDTSEIASLV